MIKIAGLQKLTLIDYPEQVAATVFLAGCNFRCGFCHNPDLVKINLENNFISESDLFNYLKSRKNLLDGVCISGGEPLIDEGVVKFLGKIKTLGYLIKLDTNGFNFLLLNKLLDKKLIDYIAMDIKSSLKNYGLVTKIKSDFHNIRQSIKLIMESNLDYEFRTTVLPKFHTLEEIEEIAKMIEGAKIYYLQNFVNKTTLDPAFQNERSFKQNELEEMRQIALKYVKNCQIRN